MVVDQLFQFPPLGESGVVSTPLGQPQVADRETRFAPGQVAQRERAACVRQVAAAQVVAPLVGDADVRR